MTITPITSTSMTTELNCLTTCEGQDIGTVQQESVSGRTGSSPNRVLPSGVFGLAQPFERWSLERCCRTAPQDECLVCDPPWCEDGPEFSP